MEITRQILEKCKGLHMGTTSFILRYNGSTFKIYKSTLEYMEYGGEYKLDEKETLNRLNYIISKQNDIKLTDMPNEILTFGGKTVGVKIKYYADCITLLDYFSQNGLDENTELIKQKVYEIVEELIHNGIIPTDPNFGNFVISFNPDKSFNIHMIDIDDQYVSVYPDGKKDVWYDADVNACYQILNLSFNNIGKKKVVQ